MGVVESAEHVVGIAVLVGCAVCDDDLVHSSAVCQVARNVLLLHLHILRATRFLLEFLARSDLGLIALLFVVALGRLQMLGQQLLIHGDEILGQVEQRLAALLLDFLLRLFNYLDLLILKLGLRMMLVVSSSLLQSHWLCKRRRLLDLGFDFVGLALGGAYPLRLYFELGGALLRSRRPLAVHGFDRFGRRLIAGPLRLLCARYDIFPLYPDHAIGKLASLQILGGFCLDLAEEALVLLMQPLGFLLLAIRVNLLFEDVLEPSLNGLGRNRSDDLVVSHPAHGLHTILLLEAVDEPLSFDSLVGTWLLDAGHHVFGDQILVRFSDRAQTQSGWLQRLFDGLIRIIFKERKQSLCSCRYFRAFGLSSGPAHVVLGILMRFGEVLFVNAHILGDYVLVGLHIGIEDLQVFTLFELRHILYLAFHAAQFVTLPLFRPRKIVF